MPQLPRGCRQAFEEAPDLADIGRHEQQRREKGLCGHPVDSPAIGTVERLMSLVLHETVVALARISKPVITLGPLGRLKGQSLSELGPSSR